MDGGAIPRAVPAVNAASVRSDLTPVRPSAPVETSPDKIVAPVGESAAVVLETKERSRLADALALADQEMERRIRLEEETSDVVTSWVDPDTKEVVRQFPAESALKLRAYVREWRQENESPGSEA